MKKVSFSLLLIAAIMVIAFAGCNATADVEEGAENVKDTVENATEFVLMDKDEIPDKIQEIADDCVGKELFFSVKHDGAFYGILSNADTGKKYVVSSVESHTIGISEFITVNLKEEDLAEGENSVTIYKATEMLDLEGVAFQMADNKAIAPSGDSVDEEQVDATSGEDVSNDPSEVIEEPTKITISAPENGATIEGGSCTIGGCMDGEAKTVTCQLVAEDGTILGEKASPVSDLSKEFNAKIDYTLAQTETRSDDGTVNGYAKVTYKNGDGSITLEATIPVKIK